MAEFYKIGVEIALVGGIQQGLEAIAAKLTGINKKAIEVEGSFRKWGAILGGVGIAGGVGILTGLKAIADHSDKLIHQQNALYRATRDWAGVVNLTNTAYGSIVKAVPTAAASDVLRAVSELRSVTGSTATALGIAPMSLKMEAVLENLTGKSAENAGFALWRALEMKGVTASNPELAQRLAFQMIQNIAGSGGKIDANTYQAWAKTGGAAWIHSTPEYIAGPGSVVAADLGGDRAGTAQMTLYNLLTGATQLSRQQFQVLADAHLVDPTKVHKIKGSSSMNIEPGAIKGSLEDAGNLFKWVQDISPNLHKLASELSAKNGLSESANFDSLLAKLGRNRNAIKMLTMFSDPGFIEQINKDLEVWSQGMPLDSAYATMLGLPRPGGYSGPHNRGRSDEATTDAQRHADYRATMGALEKQWESLMEAAGGPVARAAIPVLQSLTGAFTSLGAWVNAHPDTAEKFAKAAGAVAIGMTALGGAALLGALAAFLPGGAAAVGITALIGGLTYLGTNIGDIGAKIGAELRAIPGEILHALTHLGVGGAPDPGAPGRRSLFEKLNPTGAPHLLGEKHSFLAPSHATGGGVVNVHVALDGKVIARSTGRWFNRSGEHPRQAHYFDAYADAAPPDIHYSTN